MSNLIKKHKFRLAYKKNAFLHRKILQDKLLRLVGGGFLHDKPYALEKFFYFNNEHGTCDVDIQSVLEQYIDNGYSFIYDKDEPENGGFKWIRIDFNKYVKGAQFENKGVDEICEILSLKFNSELIYVENEYWREKNIVQLVDSANIIENRLPVSLRERLIASSVVIDDGREIASNQTFYNLKGIIKLYENLFELYLSEFRINKKLSRNKVKRYSKIINEDFSLSLYVDFGLIEANLASGNLMIPKIEVELHSIGLSQFMRPKMYLEKDNNHPIVLINPYIFLWGSTFIRKGEMDEGKLIRKAIMYFDFYSQILKVQLEYIETVIQNTLLDLKE